MKFSSLSTAVLIVLTLILLPSTTPASADALSRAIDVGMRGGYYSTDSVYEHSEGTAIDVKGVLVVGDALRTNLTVDLNLMAMVRGGQGDIGGGDATIKARYLKEGHWGFEVSALPFKYRFDDLYFELSALEVSAVLKIAENDNHQLIARAGVNPYTKRFYIDNYSKGYGTVERSIRVPIAVEYRYHHGTLLTFKAVAHYTVRAGEDALDHSWKTIESRGFLAQSVGGEGEVLFRIAKRGKNETFLNASIDAEHDTHSQNFGVQVSRSSTRVVTLAGLLLRF